MEQYYKTDVNKTERGYLSLDILFSEEVNRAIINESVNHRRIFHVNTRIETIQYYTLPSLFLVLFLYLQTLQ